MRLRLFTNAHDSRYLHATVGTKQLIQDYVAELALHIERDLLEAPESAVPRARKVLPHTNFTGTRPHLRCAQLAVKTVRAEYRYTSL